ncbi:MAG: F-type H+-transporting ATPase subunit b [Blastocatellia bacterium]|jgi:F-type H+-transporting ATPase subunit b|nr:F-type H+-transporting ATPase subunit b [Blastocatellia bacterium]
MILLAFAENSIQLVPDGTLFIHIALILVMVFVLNATLFRPINRILEERERRTRGQLDEARDTLRRVDERMNTYERSLREARAEGYRLMEQVRAEAMQERQERLNGVRGEIERSVAKEKDAVKAQVSEARATLDADAARLAAEIGSHILHRPLRDTSTTGLDSRA